MGLGFRRTGGCAPSAGGFEVHSDLGQEVVQKQGSDGASDQKREAEPPSGSNQREESAEEVHDDGGWF